MGWMRTLLLGDIGNRLDIADTERNVSGLRQSQQRTLQGLNARELEISALKKEVGRQNLAIQALTRFLVEKNLVDEQELQEFIESVDAEDGVLDGKLALDATAKPRLVFQFEEKATATPIKVSKNSPES